MAFKLKAKIKYRVRLIEVLKLRTYRSNQKTRGTHFSSYYLRANSLKRRLFSGERIRFLFPGRTTARV